MVELGLRRASIWENLERNEIKNGGREGEGKFLVSWGKEREEDDAFG